MSSLDKLDALSRSLPNQCTHSGFAGASPLRRNAAMEIDRPLAPTASGVPEPSVHASGSAVGGGELVAPTSTALRHALPRSFREPISGNVSRLLRASDAKHVLVPSLRSLFVHMLLQT